jgi:iron complex outermembrane recepter protein
MKNNSLVKFTLVMMLCSWQQLFSQQTKIKVTNANKEPLFGAGITLRSQLNNNIVLRAVTDTAGIAQLNTNESNLWLTVSSVGYNTVEKGLKITKSATIFEIVLQTTSQNLTEVTVKAKKPLLRQEDDKTIVDTESLAATSTSAYEIIEKTPGLFLDPDGNIYLNSTSPATVYINGREQKMSAADIATVLKSLPPNSIESIEIMRTPSAKYDASGSGGVVNVILKKGVKIGLTGSVSIGANQGRFGNQFAALNISNVDGGNSSYLNLSYNRRNSYDSLTTLRQLIKDRYFLSQKTYTTTPSDAVFLGFGISRELTTQTTVTVDSRLSYNPYSSSNYNTSSQILNNLTSTLGYNTTNNRGRTLSFEQGISTRYKKDSLGSEITSNWSYNYFNRESDQTLQNTFATAEPASIPRSSFGSSNNGRHFFIGQADLKLKLKNQITLETGWKSSYQNFGSDNRFINVIANANITDSRRTNTYTYQENINAAYVQASKSWGSYVLKVGARIENTNMAGSQTIPQKTEFNINRIDAFPYLYFSRKFAKIAGYELRGFLIVRRSITRPFYEALNPAVRVIDQYLYETGNPALRPQFTQTYEANISIDEAPLMAIGQNYTQDVFANVVYQDPQNKNVTYRTYSNLGTNKETYCRVMGGIPPIGKYFFLLIAQYNLNQYDGFYENSPLNFKRGSWRFYTYHQYRIDNRSSITVNGYISVKGQLQFYELGNFGALNLSLSRSFFNRKLTLTANVTDMFFTSPNTFLLQQGSIEASGRRQSDSRRVGVNIRYNFGAKKKEEKTNLFNVEG